MNRLFAALCLAGSASLAAADVYRSVDAEGNVSFSDRPAANTQPVVVAPVSNRYRHQVDYRL